MGQRQTHVVHNPNGGWDVRQVGAQRASAHLATKQEAVDRGREISQNQKTELVVHNMDGKIAYKDSHAHDPYPPKG